jgi:beta-glucosidase
MPPVRNAAHTFAAALLAASLLAGLPAAAQPSGRPWMDPRLSPERRTELVVKEMTQDEKLTLVVGYFASPWPNFTVDPQARMGSAGFVPGIERLGIPPQWQTDAGVGVATQGGAPEKRLRTTLPSGLATAATWNPDLAFAGGAMIGSEARSSGFNVMLAGGVNLTRDPRDGRNFEYAGEDPLLAGMIDGAEMRGIQSNHIISTVKHYAFNDQETGRMIDNAVIDHAAGLRSDLLAFEIALEEGQPGSVMCSYNRVDGTYACENDWLLNQVLKGRFGFKGYVMSDWGAVHSTVEAANHGLDQESGVPFDKEKYFGDALRQAIASGVVPETRLDDMARRILWAMFAKGVVDHPVAIGDIDFAAHAKVAQADEEQAIVLLRNKDALLPLDASIRRIAVIGSNADKGVLSGGGSAQVYPVGGNAVPGLQPTDWPGPVVYDPSSPLQAIQAHAPNAALAFDEGTDPAAAAKAAAAADVAIVFVHQWTAESQDFPLTLPENQDALVAAVAAANPKTIVVLETGAPVFMPWLEQAGAVLEAWFPGAGGGQAIGNVLFGTVNPSGRLPVTFPRDLSQLPRPKLDGQGLAPETPFDVNYDIEGAAVGYKWFDKNGQEPLFPFGYGLSYTRFAYSDLTLAQDAGGIVATFTVKNIGARAGMDTPQLYASDRGACGWEAPKRLAGWTKLELQPGERRTVSVRLPHDAAVLDRAACTAPLEIQLGASSRDIRATAMLPSPNAAAVR